MTRVHLVIHGRVQGVGFRYFVLRQARELGLSGWVRNRPDGSVESEAEGERDSLDALVAAVERGPGGARVSRVETRWSEGNPEYLGFDVSG